MRALRYHGPHKPLRVEEMPVPVPNQGEVRVRVTAAGLCHTELHFLSGLLDLGIAPLTLGHEVVGVVDAVGSGVDRFHGGERVIAYYYAGCGGCEFCRRGEENLCIALRAEYGFLSDGGFAEYMTIPARNAVPLPPEVSDEAAAPIGCGVTTAIHASRLAQLRAGDVVLVYGTGTVGFGLIQLAKLSGAEPIAVGRSPEKLKVARALGAAHVVDGSAGNVAERVREITAGRGADVVFEMVATKETMDQSVRSLAKRGRLVFIGYSKDSFSVHPIQLVISEASVTGSVGNTLDELHQAVRLVQDGKMRTVVDRAVPLGDFQSAVDALQRGELVGRAILKPQG